MDGSRGLRIGRIVPSRGVDVPAWPVHLAPSGSDSTLCGLDAKELRRFKQDPDHVSQPLRDRHASLRVEPHLVRRCEEEPRYSSFSVVK